MNLGISIHNVVMVLVIVALGRYLAGILMRTGAGRMPLVSSALGAVAG